MKFNRLHTFSVVVIVLISFHAKAQTSYTLQTALQTALQHNHQLKVDQYNIAIAEADVVSAKLRPNLSLSNESIQLLKSSEFAPNTAWYNNQNRQVMWQISKPLQVGGLRRNMIEVADKNLAHAKTELKEVERQLLLEVAQKWLSVWAIQNQLDLLTIGKANMDSLVQTNHHRHKNQAITSTDLFRTELLSKQYEIQYKIVSQEWDNMKKELGYLLGLNHAVDIASEDNFFKNLRTDFDNILERAFNSRSDILATKQLVEVANSNIKLQKSLSYPQPEIGLIWNPQNHIPYAGISFSLDLPLSNRNQGEIKKSHILKKQAEEQLFTQKKLLQTELHTAYSRYVRYVQSAKEYTMILEDAQTILHNVKYAYLRDGTTIVDFLEAQRAWLEVQEEYHETLQQYYQSYIHLLYVAGLIEQLAVHD